MLILLLVPRIASPAENQQEVENSDEIENLGQLSLEELSTVRVTTIATGTAKNVSEASAVATVITAQDIEAIGANYLEEVLETVPGFYVSNSGENYLAKYEIRGITSNYNPEILVMINGVPITSIVRGDRNGRLGVIPLRMVSRVEVIRGPGSAVYGADALAGVVNVITKSAADTNGSQIGGRLASFATREAWLLNGFLGNEVKYSLMADYQDTDGQSRVITRDAQTRLDGIFGTHASLAPGPVNLSEKGLALAMDLERSLWRLRGIYYSKSNVGTGQGLAEALDPQGRYSFGRTLIDLTYDNPKLAESWTFTSRFSFLHDSEEVNKYLRLFPPGANLGQGVFADGVLASPEYFERHFRFDNSAFYSGIENHRIRLGAGYAFAHLYEVKSTNNRAANNAPLPDPTNRTDTNLIYLPENSRSNIYVYGQDEWRLSDHWEAIAGVRYDYYSDFGSTVNPRLALIWKMTPALTTKFLYGHAFRPPNYIELYDANNPVAQGNPNLKAETINSYEIASSWQATENWQFGLTLFHYNLYDVIAFVKDPGSTATATAQQYGNQFGNGLEFEFTTKAASNLFFTGNYSFTKAIDVNTGKPPGDYPENKGYLRSDWEFVRNWKWHTQLTWIGERDREPNDTRDPLKGYVTVDLTLRSRAILKNLDLSASVRNVFDADVREPSRGPGPTSTSAAIPDDLPQAGRNFYVAAEYRF
jgi:iron complex outermembrane receptor protein